MSALPPIARAILRIAPADRGDWASAMACEIAAARGPGARRFALGCLCAATMLRMDAMGRGTMTTIDRPRAAALACGIAASAMGLIYLVVAGAPIAMPLSNAAALVVGLLLFTLTTGSTERTGLLVVAGAVALLATALLGASVDGAARWVRVAGIAVQPSLVLLPAMIVRHVALRSRATTAGLVIAATALAIQPDRAMAGVLALALLAGGRRSGTVATAAAALAFAATLVRPDTLPAVPWVDGVLRSAMRSGAVAGATVWAGTLVLLAPLAFARSAPARAFGACWLAIVVAAVLGHYPTPLVGYGGSAILGYLLAAAWLPAQAHATARVAADGTADAEETRLFRLAG